MLRRRDLLLASGAIAALPSAGLAAAARLQPANAAWIDALTITSEEVASRSAGIAMASGIGAVVADLAIAPRTPDAAEPALAAWNTAETPADATVRIVRSPTDLARARSEGRLGIILACQDASILGNNEISYADTNLQILEYFHELGLRVLQLTHNMRNGVGDGFQEDTDAGLSVLGRAVIRRMNELGMMIDLSHCSELTTHEAMTLSTRPVAVTHSGCRALYDSLRNKTDTTIRTLAETGGFFGVFMMSRWLTDQPTASVENVVDHIDHAVNIGGIDAVGFGSDQPLLGDATPAAEKVASLAAYQARNLGRAGAEPLRGHVTCPDMDGPDRMMILARALAVRGYGSVDREKLLGGNFARVFAAACTP